MNYNIITRNSDRFTVDSDKSATTRINTQLSALKIEVGSVAFIRIITLEPRLRAESESVEWVNRYTFGELKVVENNFIISSEGLASDEVLALLEGEKARIQIGIGDGWYDLLGESLLRISDNIFHASPCFAAGLGGGENV